MLPQRATRRVSLAEGVDARGQGVSPPVRDGRRNQAVGLRFVIILPRIGIPLREPAGPWRPSPWGGSDACGKVVGMADALLTRASLLVRLGDPQDRAAWQQ